MKSDPSVQELESWARAFSGTAKQEVVDLRHAADEMRLLVG